MCYRRVKKPNHKKDKETMKEAVPGAKKAQAELDKERQFIEELIQKGYIDATRIKEFEEKEKALQQKYR